MNEAQPKSKLDSNKIKNLIGKKFGRLEVKSFSNHKAGFYIFNCLCACGKFSKVKSAELKRGHTKSCGCLGRELIIKRNTTHGLRRTPEYAVWFSMKQRCLNKSCREFKWYGGRGTKISKNWMKFENFLKDVGRRPTGIRYTLERINTNGNYSKENCRWATYMEQANNRRNNKLITHQGKTQSLMMWSRELGFNYDRVKARVSRLGWSLEDVITKPNQIHAANSF